jgi:hypothetical protein
MSQKLNDLANGFLNTAAINCAVAITTTGTSGVAIDCLQADGRVFGIQVVGTIIGVTATHSGKWQESPTTTAASFTDISGATFAPVVTVATTGPYIQTVTFDRTQRFVRYVGVLAGVTCSVNADVLLVSQKKQL